MFRFERREVNNGEVRYKTLGTFPSFEIAWKAANGMFNEVYRINACYVDPGGGIHNQEAHFVVMKGGATEEYRISGTLRR